MSVTAEGVTFTVTVSGEAGELLDVLTKDVEPETQLDTSAGWEVCEQGIDTQRKRQITWTYKNENDVPGVCFAFARGDVDTDGDGVSDAIEQYVEGTDPLVDENADTGTDDGDSDEEGSDATEEEDTDSDITVGNDGSVTGSVARDGIIHVSSALGSDNFDGFAASVVDAVSGPKRTISAALDVAQPGEIIKVWRGIYNEDISICGRDVKLVTDGEVVLR